MRVRALGLGLMLMIVVSGCDAVSSLPSSESSAMILSVFQNTDCKPQQLGRTAERGMGFSQQWEDSTPEQVGALNTWLATHVEQNPAYRLVSTEPYRAGAVYGATKTYSQAIDGHPQSLSIDQSDYQYSEGGRDIHYVNTGITLCVAVPASITVLDTTIDPGGKTARVIFKAQWKLTPLAQELNESGLLGQTLTAPAPLENTIPFKKLDATGWRIAPLGF